jgi:hypothetical protein
MKDKPFSLQAIMGCLVSNVAMVIFSFKDEKKKVVKIQSTMEFHII